MNNKGFIATSLIYSFFLIFITLFLTIIADYLQNKVLLNTIEKGIKEDINNSMGIQDFEVGDIINFNIDNIDDYEDIKCNAGECNFDNEESYIVCDIKYKTYGYYTDSILLSDVSNNKDCDNESAKIEMKIEGYRFKINPDGTDNTINISGVE